MRCKNRSERPSERIRTVPSSLRPVGSESWIRIGGVPGHAPGSFGFHYERGMARLASGDLDGAIADLSEALDQNVLYVDGYLDRGYARLRQGDGDGALRDF